tara:strand:- start:3072 stop:3527 length:456 start_codon:yes stop_codon:yes gene_type:complete
MRVVIQRVTKADVTINSNQICQIKDGLIILLGIQIDDSNKDILWLVRKISNLRIFSDNDAKMNNSVIDVNGEIIIVSQFTLHAKTKKGNRPSFITAAKPDIAIPLYEEFILKLKSETGLNIYSGEFGADMQVSLINDGPVTIILDSKFRDF